MPDSRFLTNTPATISAIFYTDETVADPGVVTVTITSSDGTVLVTDAATGGTGAAARTYALAAQSDVDILTAVWEAPARQVTTRHEVVGSYVCELGEIRAQRNMESGSKFPTAALEQARWWFEDLAEDFCGQGFSRRFRVEQLSGGASTLLLARAGPVTVRWATVGGTAADVSDWVVQPYGAVYTPAVTIAGVGNVLVGYEHGPISPPADVRRAALTAIRARLLTDEAAGIPDRSTGMSNEMGSFTYIAQPGQKRATGWPEVDAVLSRHRTPTVA